MSTGTPEIEIIIPNWNGCHFLKVCLDSLSRQSFTDFSITVVDNGSTDGSLELLRDQFPHVKLISFPKNRGFSVAVNTGIVQSDKEWLMLLNNDIEVDRECLQMIHAGIEKYPGYDCFSVKMVSYDQRDILDGAGDAVLRGGVGYRIGTLECDRGQYDQDRDVFGACAGAAVYSKRFIDEVGLFDEDFFAYLEDVDLNMRAARAGLRCRYLGSAVVYHIGSATTGSKINPFTVSLSTRNNINVLIKNYPASVLLRFFPVIIIYQLMWLAFVVKKKQLPAYFSGMWQALGQLPGMWQKRRRLVAVGTVSARAFGDLLKESERTAVDSIMARRTSLGKGNLLLQTYCKIFL